MMTPFVEESVRGTYGDTSWLSNSGLETARSMVTGQMPPPPIRHLTGLTPTEAGLGSMTFSMPVNDWFQDTTGVIWGGIYALLADAPISVSLLTGLPPGKSLTTSELSINYLRPPILGSTLVGRGRSVYLGREVGVAEATVEDGHGRVMAHATTRCVVIDFSGVEASEPPPVPEPIVDPPDPYLRPVPQDILAGPGVWDRGKLEVQRRMLSGEMPPGPVQMLTGIQYQEIDHGYCQITFPASPWFSSGTPYIYGGVLALACDCTLGGAVWSTLDADAIAATLDLQIRFLRPVPLDGRPITITSTIKHSGRRIRVAEAEAFDANGKRVAIALGSSMVIPGGVEKLKQGLSADEIVRR